MITYTIYLLSVALDTNVALMNPHLEAFSKHLQCFLGLELLSTVIFNKRRIMIKSIYSLFTLNSHPGILFFSSSFPIFKRECEHVPRIFQDYGICLFLDL